MIVPLTSIDTFKAQTATAQECDPNSVQLAKGSQGPKVIELQTHLTTLGLGDMLGQHGPNQVGIDGIFGEDTKKTVIKFQQDNGLLPDGIVGSNTWAAICSALQPVPPPVPPPVPLPVPPPVPPPPDVQSGFGEFLGTGESEIAPQNVAPQNAEPEEDLEANPEQAEQEKNEANSETPDFLASLDDKNILDVPANDSFQIGSIPALNTSLGIAPSAAPQGLTAAGPGAGSPTLTAITFEGINQLNSSFSPPDVSLAVGVRRAVEMVNDGFQVYDKVGDQLIPDKVFTPTALFKIGAPSPVDPNIVFDPVSKIFFASAMDLASKSIRIAVSKPDVATTTSLDPPNWKIFNFPIGNCPGQPWITISSDKVAISVNTFIKKSDVSCLRTFLGTQTLLIGKNDLINGVQKPAFKVTPTVSATKPKLDTFREVPVRTFGTDEKITLVSIQKDARGFNLNAVKMKTISGPIKSDIPLPASAISTKIIPFLKKGPPKPAPDGIQPQTKKCESDTQLRPCIKTGFLQVSSASMSSDNKVLWLAFHESCKNPAPTPVRKIISCIRLVEIDTNSGQIGSPKAVVTQDFSISRRNMDFYYPTVTFDGSKGSGTNIMLVGFGGSNSTVFPSLFAFGQKFTGTTMPIIELKKGGGRYVLPSATPPEKPQARYGDYFGSAVDPTDSTIRWIAGEYIQVAPATGPNPLWSSAISRVTLASPLPGEAASSGNGTAVSSAVNTSEALAGGLACSDGTAPDVTTDLCADGSIPQPVNATALPPAVTTAEQQLICSDGTAPDVTTDLCADGSQPQAFNATVAPSPTEQLGCADGNLPDASGLCADGSIPQPVNPPLT